MNYQTDMHNSV